MWRMASSGKLGRAHRLMVWAAALCLPAGIIVGGIIGVWSGSVRIGVALGAAVGFCAAIALLAALAVTAATQT